MKNHGQLGARISSYFGVWLIALTACHGNVDAEPAPKRVKPAFPVEVAQVAAARVEYSVAAMGSVEAFETVAITARVPGVIERMLFAEGDVVARGQPLAEIELGRYMLAVRASEASLERANAALSEAEGGVTRRERAIAQTPGIIPGEEMTAWHTRAQTLAAEVKQAEVSLEQAQLNLHDAHVRAPQAGIIQSRDVRTGQYVQAGTPLGGLLQRDPLLLRFAVAEADAARLHPGMAASFAVRGGDHERSAEIIHVAAAADATTRMVGVLARVRDSKGAALRPGVFAEVTVAVGADARAAVIPQTAVRSSERGFLAYVVEKDVVQERKIQLGMRTSDSRVEVRSGLALGETLVIRGIEALADGARITVVASQAQREIAESSIDGSRRNDAEGAP